LKAFIGKSDRHEVYATTCSVGDAVYMPAGFTFYEAVGKQTDFIGVRTPLLMVDDACCLRFIDDFLVKAGSPSQPLSRACDALTKAE
jgi:hypothetical protein